MPLSKLHKGAYGWASSSLISVTRGVYPGSDRPWLEGINKGLINKDTDSEPRKGRSGRRASDQWK